LAGVILPELFLYPSYLGRYISHISFIDRRNAYYKSCFGATQSLFKEINHKGEAPYAFLGREGRLKSSIQDDKIGMMEVFIGSDPMTLMVRSKDGSRLEHGTHVMIVDEEPDKRIYYVQRSMRY
jgi:hypothetical protein